MPREQQVDFVMEFLREGDVTSPRTRVMHGENLADEDVVSNRLPRNGL